MNRKTVPKMVFSLITAILLVLTTSLRSNATGTSYLMYNSSLSAGRINGISSVLTTKGYSNTISSNPTATILQNRLASGEVVFIHTHGYSSGSNLVLASNTSLAANQVTSAGVTLAYLSACYSGKYNVSNGCYPDNLSALGVDMVVSFRSTISASCDSDGIHWFNYLVFYYLCQGNTLADAVTVSRLQLYSVSGSYWGTNYTYYKGPNNTL